MPSSSSNVTRFWRPASLGGAEFVFGSYGHQVFPRHFHEEYVIAIMVRGTERLRHARGTELVPARSLILLNPGQVHENGPADDSGFAYRTLYAPAQVVQSCLADSIHREAPLPVFSEAVASDRETFAVLRRLHSAVEASEPTLRMHTLLAAGLSRLFERHVAVPLPRELARPSRRTIALVRDYLDAHFAENISLDVLSRLAGLSAYHLVRSFRDEVGLPPCQYQIHRRVLHASRRLRQGAPIALAAYEAGFVDQSHLNRHWRGNKETLTLGMLGSNPFPDPTGRQWKRLPNTDLWYKPERMLSDARFGYAISENGGPYKPDPLNPNMLAGRSVAEFPNAPEEPSIEKRPKIPPGTLTKHKIRSESLDEDRSIGVYLPANYGEQGEPYPLLVVFDGESHGSRPESAIQMPTILDNLFEMKRLPPLVAVLVDSQATRDRDLLCSDGFSNFLANELVPWCRQKYRISRDPSRAVVAGESYGGLCAAYTAFRHSDVFGNVLSLSGTFSYHQNWGQKEITDYYSVETGWLTRQLASHLKLPVRFYLAVGRFEAGPNGGLLRENRHLRDVLEARGYPVAYSEYSGGHDYVGWRVAFVKGLINLIGSAGREPQPHP